jgi:hypothetical protein
MTTEELLIEVGALLYVAEIRRRARAGASEAEILAWADAVMATASERLTMIEQSVQATCN